MRLGVITDAHLSPNGTRVPFFHNASRTTDAKALFRLALERCVEGGADVVALLGDLSHLGDAASLEGGLCLASGTGLPAWIVPGNHDVGERWDALAEAVGRVDARNVRLATPEGEAVEEGFRIAGLPVRRGDRGFASRSGGFPDASRWREDELVVLLSHYPAVSSVRRAANAGLKYAGDLEDLDEVAPLLGRAAPTVVLSGHLHLRDAFVEGRALQLSCAALVEPPREVNFLDVEREGDRVVVRREAVPVVSSSPGARLPVLSPPEEEWVFGAGAWGSMEPTRARAGTRSDHE